MKPITDIFIKHPVLAIVVNLVIVLVGWRAISSLPVQQYPQLDSSSLIITTVYTGASAEAVRGFLTTPIERAVSAIAGVDHIESTSRAGVSTVTVRLKLNHDSTKALAEVSARLQQVRSELPADAEPPQIEVQRADRPYATFYISFVATERSVSSLTDLLTRTVQPQLSTIEGVQRVTNDEGGRRIAMRIWIDPDRLAALGLTPGDVYASIERNNHLAAVGRTKGREVQVNLLANTDLRTREEFESLIVADRGGAVVRLRDVARVELGAEEATFIAKYNDREGVFLGVWTQVGANEIAVAERLRAEMERIRPSLPKDVEMKLVWDGTMFMRDALSEITKTLAETIAIVGLVVFLFLGSARTALVPLIAMPVSLLGATVVMLAFGFSLNLLTILAIVLSVGLVVDDAIVVVENVARHVREGRSRIDAALVAARELFGPIIAMTITLAAVYTPIGFQGGLTGSLFLEFAITLAAAVIVSGLVAITLSPVMSAHVVAKDGSEGWLTRRVNRGFDAVRALYVRLLDDALAIRWAFVLASFLIAAAAWPFYQFSARELAPAEDQSHISFFLDAAPDSTIEAVNRQSLQVARTVASFPEAQFMWSLTADWGGFGGMVTKNWKERDRSTAEMFGEVYGAVSQIPGVRVFPRLDPPLPTPGQYDVELVLQSDKPLEQMLETVQAVVGAGWQSGKFLYVDTDLKIDRPEARVVIDREQVADLGLDLASVGRELGTLLGGGYVNRFNFYDRSYKVIPQIGDEDRATVGPLLDLKIRTPDGDLVPVSTFTRIESITAPRTLNRFQQRNAVRVFGGVQPGVTKEEGLRVLEAAAASIGDPSMLVDYAGESRQIRREGSALTVTLGFALVLIYLVLAAQFRSFRDPLIVLLGSVPLAISGALAFSFAELTTINIYSQVGLITLVGLVAKNGILIVEFANTLRERGLSKLDALREASATRLRPVLMTSAATIFGHLPLVFVSGPGAEARNSIGIILVAGMAVGTLFTLFVVPVFYALIAAERTGETEDAVESGGGRRLPLPAGAVSILIVSVVFTLGCAVGPAYHRPAVDVPVAHRGAPVTVGEAASLADRPWWELLEDETLVALIEEALQHNTDLRVAVARIEEARAEAGIARAARYPALEASAGWSRSRVYFFGSPFTETAGLYDVNLGLSWEIDLWGRVRSLEDAALARYLATEEARRGVVVSLVAEVATSYFQLLALDRELEIALSTADSFRETKAVFEGRLDAGTASALETASATADLATTESAIPDLRRRVAALENALSVLLGRTPGDIPRGRVLDAQPLPPRVPAGLPSALLLRRPDLREAEQRLIAANADVGVAIAETLPTLRLTGAFGGLAPEVSGLFDEGKSWSLGGGLLAPVVQGQRLARQKEAARARWEQEKAHYEQSVLRAFAEVSTALVAYEQLEAVEAKQREAVVSYREAVEMANTRYLTGLSGYLEVLQAQRQLFPAENQLARTRFERLAALVDLYRSLGGGWVD